MPRQLDNIDIAILTKLNELADRYGVKPYEFIATLDHSSEVRYMGVRFVVPAETDPRQETKIKRMLKSLGADLEPGVPDLRGVLKGGEIAVLKAIDAALSVAPKSHSRT